MTILEGLDLASKLFLFGWFGYARRHFAEGGTEPIGMTVVKLTFLVGLGLNLWLFFSLPGIPAVFRLLGLVTTLSAATIFHFAARASKLAKLHVAFSDTTGKTLVSSGIYRFVRHPFYLSYIIYWLSWCISLFFSLQPVALLVFLLALYALSIRVEEKHLERNFGDEYREYRKRTSLLVPRLL